MRSSDEWKALVPGARDDVEAAMLKAGFTSKGTWGGYEGGRQWTHEGHPDVTIGVSVHAPNRAYLGGRTFYEGINCQVASWKAAMRTRTYRYGKNGWNLAGITAVALEMVAAASFRDSAEKQQREWNAVSKEVIEQVCSTAGVGTHHFRRTCGKLQLLSDIPLDKLEGLVEYLKAEGIIEAEAT